MTWTPSTGAEHDAPPTPGRTAVATLHSERAEDA
jgi:hypothetical protein